MSTNSFSIIKILDRSFWCIFTVLNYQVI